MQQKLMRYLSLAIFLAGLAAFSFVSQLDAAEGACTCPPGGPMQPCCTCGCQKPPTE